MRGAALVCPALRDLVSSGVRVNSLAWACAKFQSLRMRMAVWSLANWLALMAIVGAEESRLETAKEAFAREDYSRVIELLQGGAGTEDVAAKQLLAASHQRRGEVHFQNARIEESLKDFDRVLELIPEQAPHHWQRGIACYYAGRYADGAAQFELHRTVNPDDVENAVWHFLCVVRSPGGSVKLARSRLFPVKEDGRVPMKEIHDLFAGYTTADAVLAAGRAGGDLSRFYADLYVGLYDEALGKAAESSQLIAQAAVNPKANHYMGDVARTHLLVREGAKR